MIKKQQVLIQTQILQKYTNCWQWQSSSRAKKQSQAAKTVAAAPNKGSQNQPQTTPNKGSQNQQAAPSPQLQSLSFSADLSNLPKQQQQELHHRQNKEYLFKPLQPYPEIQELLTAEIAGCQHLP